MAIVVNTNIPSLVSQNSLNSATSSLNSSLERMSTGLKINRAADDAAGLFIANNMDTQIRGSQVAQDNVQTGINMLQKTEGDLTVIQDHLSRIRDLAVTASSEFYSEDSLTAIKKEVTSRVDEINRIANAAEFNGINLLDGTTDEIAIQVGPNSDKATNSINITGVFENATTSAGGLGLFAAATDADNGEFKDVDAAFFNASTSAMFIDSVDVALSDVATRRTEIGAVQNRLTSAADSLTTQIENLSSAKSTIMDTDIAAESAEYVKAQILQQSSATLLAAANQAPSIALSLI